MPLAELPNTKQVGLGMAALGRPGYINLGHADDLQRDYSVDVMRQHAHLVLDAAWKAGVCYFDAARSYGQAESFLATWLAGRSFEQGRPFVASKWGYEYTADWQVQVTAGQSHEVKQHSRELLDRQYSESQQHLGKFLNLYQIHSATLASGVLENEAVLRRLGELRDAGLPVGLSVSGAEQAETIGRALQIEVDGQPLFSAVQATWNVLEPAAGDALAEAHAAGWLVVVKEALANGRLTDRNDDPAFAEKLRVLQAAAQKAGTSTDSLALAAALQQPWSHVVLSGAASVEHVRSNLQSVEIYQQLDNDLAESLLEDLSEPSADYWATRASLDWN